MIFLKEYDKVGIIYKENEISYKNIIKNSKSFGKKLNIEKEDKVMIFMENRPELIYSFFGIWDKKGTCVVVDSSFSSKELNYYILDSKPKYIFTSREKFKCVKESIDYLGEKIEILVAEEIELDYRENNLEISLNDTNMVALMLYTSGTTGKPKGVMLTLDNIAVNVEGLKKYNMYTSGDRILGLLPMHHILSLLGTGILPLLEGGTIVFLEEVSSLAMIEALKKYKITFIVGVPKLWEILHKKIMEKINSKILTKSVFKLSKKIKNINIRKRIFKKVHEGLGGSIRFLVSGGSKLDREISSDFLTLGIEICEGYGLTETAPMISFTPIGNVVPGSAGIILDGIKVKVEEDGEIVVKGRNVMKGYYNKSEETEKVIDKNGWFHTGDLGKLEGKNLYIIGRKKEMIVLSNGKNINPIEIEQKLIRDNDLIKEVVILDYEGRLTALIHPDFSKLYEKKITNIVETFKTNVIGKYNESSPKHMKILDVRISKQELPKTKIGKIRRFLIKDLIDKKEENIKLEEPNFKEYIKISNYIKKLKKIKLTPCSHLEIDLGMDSLDLVELVSYIEASFGVNIDEQILSKHSSVESLAKYVSNHSDEIKDKEIKWKDRLSFEKDYKFPTSNRIGKILKFILKIPFKFYFRIKKEGLNKLDLKETSIFVGNHQSFLDGFILSQVLSNKILDNTYFFAKIKHFEKKYMKIIGENSNVILVDINKNLIGSMQMLASALKKGKNIVIFPEGTRSTDGELGRFKKFFAILAVELKIPIQPFVIKGAYELYSKGSKYPKPGEINIKFLDKIYPNSISDYDKLSEKIWKIIKKEI